MILDVCKDCVKIYLLYDTGRIGKTKETEIIVKGGG